MLKEIIEISYPVSAIKPEQEIFTVGNTCIAIKNIQKNGEMASIDFYEIELNDGTFIEIRASDTLSRFRKIEEDNICPI